MAHDSDDDIDQHRLDQEGHDMNNLQYAIEDVPPWYLWIVLGFQHFLTMVGGSIAIPLILASGFCIQVGEYSDEVAKAELMGTIFFVSGIITFLQTTLGVRLPIVQGGTFSFLPPTFAILATFGECPVVLPISANISEYYTNNPNTTLPVVLVGSAEHRELWRERLRTVQGAIMISSLFQIAIGLTGVLGLVLRYISPIVVACTISLIGLSLFSSAGTSAATHWGISFLTVALLALFAEYMRKIRVPCFSKSAGGCSVKHGYPLFRLFPVILAISVSYVVCIALTYTNVFTTDSSKPSYKARTDSRISVLSNAEWLRFPYPGQWGTPIITVSGVFGMLAGVLVGIIESVGDYYAAARLSGAPPPTTAAINRGIFVEGIGCLLAGAWGSGSGTTSYSENIGALGITQVGSRRVIQTGAVIMIILGVIGKFCAVFVTIPDPIIGGVYLVMFGMVVAVGLSNLQFVDLNSSRNLFIVGLSIMLGLAVPDWASKNADQIDTGNKVADEVIIVLLRTSMFVGGFMAFFLDNTIPGTKEERGLLTWSQSNIAKLKHHNKTGFSSYDMPFGNEAIYRAKWTSYIPICPNFLSHRANEELSSTDGRKNGGFIADAQMTNL